MCNPMELGWKWPSGADLVNGWIREGKKMDGNGWSRQVCQARLGEIQNGWLFLQPAIAFFKMSRQLTEQKMNAGKRMGGSSGMNGNGSCMPILQ